MGIRKTRKTRRIIYKRKTQKKGGSSSSAISITPEVSAILASTIAMAVRSATHQISALSSSNTSGLTFGNSSTATAKTRVKTQKSRKRLSIIKEVEPEIKQFVDSKSIDRGDMLQYNVDNDATRILRIKQLDGTKLRGDDYKFKGAYEREYVDPSKLELVQTATDFSRGKINAKLDSCDEKCLDKIDSIGGITAVKSLINGIYHYFVVDGNHSAQVAIQLGALLGVNEIGPVVVIGDITISKKINIKTNSGKEKVIDIIDDLQDKIHEESKKPGNIEIPTKNSIKKLKAQHKKSVKAMKKKSKLDNKFNKKAILEKVREMQSRLNKYLEEDDSFRKTFIK